MELNFKSFGQGPALIILHGLFGSLDNWNTLARQFGEHFSTYIIDQRNHGRSPWSDEENTYEAMASDLAEFMDQQGIPSASLIGHSMGGKTVMTFAVDHPDRVEKLIVADMATREYPPHHTEILETLIHFPAWKIESRSEAEEILEQRIPDVSTRMFLLKNLDRKEGGGFEWKFNLDVLYRDYERILDGIHTSFPYDGPTLFIRGGKSDYVKDAYFPEIREIFPNAIFSTVEGAGHWLHAEKPVDFFNQVMTFLLP